MDDDAIFAASANRRRAVADLLETLDERQLDTQSLCAQWTVRQVAGHLLSAITLTGRNFVSALVRSGFRPHAANTLMARQAADQPVQAMAAAFREHAESRFRPPVTGARAPLTDLLVHEADMRVPLGLPYDPPLTDAAVALEFLTGRAFGFVPRGRLAGLRLAPTDLDRAWGDGAEVTGRAADLMLVVCGRTAVLPSLAGPGAELLAQRVSG